MPNSQEGPRLCTLKCCKSLIMGVSVVAAWLWQVKLALSGFLVAWWEVLVGLGEPLLDQDFILLLEVFLRCILRIVGYRVMPLWLALVCHRQLVINWMHFWEGVSLN